MRKMKKKIVKYETVCDLCGKLATTKCELCGRDICSECARYIVKENVTQVSTGFTTYFLTGPSYTKEMTLCKRCAENIRLSIRNLKGEGLRRKLKGNGNE